MEKANCQNACSQKIYAKLLNNLLTNSCCKKGIYGSDQCENIGFLAQAGNNLKELAFTNLKIRAIPWHFHGNQRVIFLQEHDFQE